ncbi:DUF2341 domain-containing protein [Candidatus Nomurabacteria bacterium]|nr:DUF2341 domain-containing protein [Candidatus Nomurabacteria bacterium]
MNKKQFHNTIKNRIKALFKAPDGRKRVFDVLKFNTKQVPFLILAVFVTCALPYVHAQFYANAVIVRTVNVFPAKITAPGWKNAETLNFQNLDEYALLQEFNSINSATIDKGWSLQPGETKLPADKPEAINTQKNAQSASSLDSSTSTPESEVEVTGASTTTVQFDVIENDVTESAFDEIISSQDTSTQEVIEPEIIIDKDVPDEATTTVMRRVESLFALAVSSVTSFFDSSATTDEQPPKEEVVDSTELENPEVLVNELDFSTLNSSTITTEEVFEENLSPATPNTQEVEIVATSTEVSTEIEAFNTSSETATGIVEETLNIASTTNQPVEKIADQVNQELKLETEDKIECLENCIPYVISLSDFGFPLDEKVEITGAQLRLSFAARKKETRNHIPEFSIRYSLDGAKSWTEAGSVVIDDESSNSVNGGYYLFALPEVVDQEALNNLQVELVYLDNPEVLDNLYVESAWLELFTLETSTDQPLVDFEELLRDDGFDEELLSGDNLVLPDGKELKFEFTDNNKDETLIIKTNEVTYAGLSEATTYFSVTNTSNSSDEFSVKTYFPAGVGEVTSLEVFNQNKPRQAVIPEYRPYVYHCEGGWEYAGEVLPQTLQELSESLSGGGALSPEDSSVTTTPEITEFIESIETKDNSEAVEETNVDFSLPTSTEENVIEFNLPTSSNTTTVLRQLNTLSQLLQFSTVTTNTVDFAQTLDQIDSASSTAVSGEDLVQSYSCRNTNVVRVCDELDGSNTACKMSQVKVQDHQITKYAPGWDTSTIKEGSAPRPSFLRRVAEFIGFGPNRKEIPEDFEVRVHTPDTYAIEPGETKYFKMDISFPPFSRGEYWIEAVGNSEYGLLDPFWSSEWQYRIPVKVSNPTDEPQSEYQVLFELDSSLADFWSNVNSDGSDIRFVQETRLGNLYDSTGPEFGNLFGEAWGGRIALVIASTSVSTGVTDFPVFVDLSTLGSVFWSGVASDGSDIRITKQDGFSELPYDLVEIDAVAQTGELHFLADSLSSVSDNIFHIYFDNSSATAYAPTDPYGSQAVWTNYEAVYHFSDDPTTVTSVITDETGNGQEIEVEGAGLATTTGAMGTALDMIGSAGILRDVGDDWAWIGGDDLVSTGLYYQTTSSGEAIWEFGSSANPNWAAYMPWYSNASTTGRGYLYFGSNQSGTWARDIDVWHHFTTIAPATTGQLHGIYDNAVLELSNTQSTAAPSNLGGLQIGRWTTAGSYNGMIDELRFASNDDAFSSGWVATEHLNQTDPTNFYSTSTSILVGGENVSGWFSTSWDNRVKFTLAQAEDNISDFPVYLDLSTLGDDFFTNVASDGRDIRVTTGDSRTELPFELVSIDTSAKTGELYFKTDLTQDSTTDYYIYYNNSDAAAYSPTATYGSENVWTNGFQAVYHLEESAAGTSNPDVYKDSTSNHYHGDDENASVGKYGLFGKGQQFGLDSSDYLSLPYQAMDGLTDNSVSWWHISSSSDDQTILSGANAVQFNEFWERLDNNNSLIIYSQGGGRTFNLSDTVVNYADNTWQYYLTTSEDAIDEVNAYINGVGDSANPDPLTISALDIDSGGLIVGQDQDALGGGFSTAENFEGFLDELRIASVVRSAAWAAAEYENMANQNSFISVSDSETLTETNFVELDFWIQHFDDTAEEADIWVQVEDLAVGDDTIIYLYYGSPGASTASDEMATFTYSTSTDIFYVVDDHGATSISIQSLVDNNEVSLDGGTPIPLNQGESTIFTSGTFDGDSVISILGPISGTVTGAGNDGGDMLAPISFATSSFAIPTSRSTDQWFVYAPFASTTARIYKGSSGTALGTANIATSTSHTFSVNITNTNQGVDGDGAVVEASSPVLLTHRHTTQGDGMVVYPPTIRDIFGFNNQYMHFSALASNSDPLLSCSAGAGGTLTGITRGDQEADASCTAGGEGSGSAVRASGQAGPIAALSQADGDGNESTIFWPQHEFGTRYAMTNDSAYAAVVCSPRFGATTLEIQDSAGNTVDTGTCTPGATTPGKAFFNNGNGTDGDAVNYVAGHQVVSTNGVPFKVIYEDVKVEQDEKNISGSVQARKFAGEYTTFIFGEQEIANDAEYEQLSFRWYQNNGLLAPATAWALNDTEFVSEGGAIIGAGAVADTDVLRLRMNLRASNATGTENSAAFNLQYAVGTAGQCDLVSDWFDIGEQGSTTAAFSGYDNPSVGDGKTLSTTKLAASTVLGTYEERNHSDFLPNDVPVNGVVEFDWVIEATNVDVNTNYCFRMTRVSGVELVTYTLYPELETVGPPNTPTNVVFFDNEKTNVLTPVLEFYTIDIAGDDVHYRVQIDDDYDFTSVVLDRNSDSHFSEFENLDLPSDKAPFTSGNRIRFTSSSGLSPTTTYWYRVRASDPDGSATSSDWSVPTSFTTDTVITVSEWLQTTTEQFQTNSLSGVTVSGNQVSVSVNPGTMTSTPIDFDDAVVGNAWGEVSWNDTETSGAITIQVQYNNNGNWTLIPDSQITGNSVGISTSPINILSLDTSIYNEIRLVATFTGTTLSLQDWSVKWGLRVETPVQGDLFDNQKVNTTVPHFDFLSNDPQGDDLEYEISFSTDINFILSSSTYNSSTSPGFASQLYTSGDTAVYITQPGDAFTNGLTYWWRTRARDTLGGNSWSSWAEPDSFTVDTGISLSTWFQTTKEQFEQGFTEGTIASTSNSVIMSDDVGEYGTVALTDNNEVTITTQRTYENMVVVASPEYSSTIFTDARTPRVYDKTSNSFKIKVDNYTGGFVGSTAVDYIVMEAGDWTIADGATGFRVLAGTESVTAVQNQPYLNGVGSLITFSPAFSTAPVPLATLASNNDSTWAGIAIDDRVGYLNEVTTSQMGLSLSKSRSLLSHSEAEDVDYIVFAPKIGTNNGVKFRSFNSSDNVDDYPTNGGYGQALGAGFTSTPGVTLTANNGTDGSDGAFIFKNLSGTQSNSSLFLSAHEMGATADAHTQEISSIVAFESSSGMIARQNSGNLSGTFAGEDIVFSDGAGPKFDNFSWSATTPGASTVSVQIQYQVSEGVYALIPNSQIPGNSVGTTTSPIDLTGVDIDLYPVIRAFATLSCNSGNCPSLDDWKLEWSEGVNMSGTLKEYDRLTNVATGTIMAAVNGIPVASSATASSGVWTISNVTAFAGDIVTVWVDGATESEEAVAAFVYDGIGDISGVELFEQHLSISSNEEETVTNTLLGMYDNLASGDEDIFFDVDGSNNLVLCSVGTCSDANIYIGLGNTYIPASTGGVSVSTHDFVNDGFIELDSNTFNVSGSWKNYATSSTDTSVLNMTAATGTESISSTESPLNFHTVSFGSGIGDATFLIPDNLDLSGSLTVASGTLSRDGLMLSVAGNITTGTAGFWLGTGTTTFDGAGSKTWRDDNPVTQIIGDVLIDGASTIVTALTDVGAYDIRIGTNDRLNGSSGNTIFVAGDWKNSGTYSAQNGTVEIINDNRSYPPIVPGSQDWYVDSSFDSRIMLELNHAEVPGDLSDFPLYVDLSTLGNSFWSEVANDGHDIRVTSGDGQTELPYDLVRINTTTKNGELHFLADNVESSTSTYFFIYFNNPTATTYQTYDTYGSEAVWTDYEAVYHFNDDPTAVDNYVLDSTTNQRHLLVEAAALATSTGKLGLGINLIGSTGILRNAGFTWQSGNPLITSGWYKMPAASNESLWQWGTGASPDNLEYRPWYSGVTGLHYFGVTSGATYSQTPRDTTNWVHFTTVGATSTSQDNVVYQNSLEVERITQTVANPYNNGATGLQVGRNGTTNSLQAQLDEFRITTITRNQSWVQAEYNNQHSPTIFYSTTTVQSYTPDLVIDEPTHNISTGGSSFYNLIINDATTSPAFINPSVSVLGTFTVATGTIALPTGTLTVGRSFINNGYFMHNNGEVKFTSTVPATITLNGTQFFNALYNVTFSGTGSWTFSDLNATSSNDVIINNGSVVFPTGVMTIGGTLDVNAGSFNANNGTVKFTSSENEDVTTKGSSFNNVIFGLNDSTVGWYNSDWARRSVITIASTSVAGAVTGFPVYIDLSMLGDEFWSNVQSDGDGIRITSANGKTELPYDLVEFSAGLRTGELHFLAPSLSSISDTNFYLYYDNPEATAYESGDTYGSEAVWVEYEAVYHFNEDPVGGITDASGNGKDLVPTVGTPLTTAGVLGTALDTTPSSVMLEDSDWTWTSGEDLVSSGLYFQSAVDTGALWEWGSSCSTDDCLAYMPWYDSGDRGYNRFGETSGNDFRFTRDNSKWHHFTTNGRATDGEPVQIFEDSILRGSYLQSSTGENPSQTGLQIGRYVTNTYMDIDIDELRFATTTRSQQWITTEYNNLTNVDDFYSTSTELYLEVVPSFTLDEVTTDVNGDVTIYYANLVAPSNNLKIGGSALNVGGSYDPNNATTTFDSNDIGETVEFGDGAFYNLSFNGIGGGWTISTTTVANNTSLVAGADFTLSPGNTLFVGGIFSNAFSAVSTTWTGSTLALSGGDYTVTGRLDSGDDYARLIVSGDSDLVIWNSSVSTSTIRDTSSLYMPDYDTVDGQLRIYGDYTRASGVEYWSYDTDFDGTNLSGGGERPVAVSIGRGSAILFATSTSLEVIGTIGATTTVQAITGIYSLKVNAGTFDGQYASFSNIGPLGLQLSNGTVINNFSNSEFSVAGGRTGITADATTINAQPSAEYVGIIFSTSSANSIYEPAWIDQVVVKIFSGTVNEDLIDYPVYIDLSTLGSSFWSGVQSDGRDIRITTNNGLELPFDLVEINTITKTGELHFLAPLVSSGQDTAFYVHFNNPAATSYLATDEYGANAVWSNYEAVYHFNEDPTLSITDMTGNGRDLYPTVGSMATTSGLLGTALDTTASNARIENVAWTWTPGDDLISSGLYYMSNFDTGALWQFGAGNGSNNGTYLAYLPWYNSATRGYHFFGITSGGDYDFARNNAIWHHFTTIGRAADGATSEFYEDNLLRDSVTQITSSANPSNTGLRIGAYQNSTYLDVDVDELRFATVVPSTNRIDAEHLNFTDPSSFYSTSSAEVLTYNVTADGVPSTFWLFSAGSGNIYGESFDNDDGDPGSIQWDDSNFAVTISGVVYSDDGVTPEGFPVCNGSTEVVTIVLDGVTTYTAPCNPIDGTYRVEGIAYVGEPIITAYIESSATENQTNVTIYDETTGVGTVASNIMTVARPSVVDDSVLVLIAGKDDDINFGTASGWTSVDIQGVNSDDQIAVGIWYKVVSDAGTEPATYDFPIVDGGEEYNYWMGSLLNVDTVTPVDVASTWTKLINSIAPNAPQITTVTNGALVLSAWYVDSEVEVTPPVYGWDDRARNVVGAGLNNLTVSSQLFETAGPTGSSTLTGATLNSDPYVGQFAFRPAANPTATGSMVAAVVTKTPLGNSGSPYEDIELRDTRAGTGLVDFATNITVNRPVVENGDVLVMFIAREDDFSIAGPPGWVAAQERIEGTGNDMYSGIWYKVVTNAGAEPATYDFLNNDTAGTEEYSYWIGSFDGVDTGNVFDTSDSWSNLQNTSTPAAPSITTVTNGSYVLAGWYVIDDASLDMPGAPWTTLADDIQTGSRLLAVAGRSFATAGATGAVTLTNGSTDDVNVGQFALRPAQVSVASKIKDMDLYQNRVIVRHENIDPLTIADMDIFDNGNESDLPFTVTIGSPDQLNVLSGSGLFVWGGKTFAPTGEINLQGNGSTVADGSLNLGTGSTFTSVGTNPITIGGSLYTGTGATFTGASSLVTFTATNAGQQIGSAASSTLTFNSLAFNGVGGNWAVKTPILSQTGISVATGTVSGIANITVDTGSFSGNGTVDMTGGLTTIRRTNTLGGARAWTFNSLTLGNGSTAGVTTPAGIATTSVRSVLTIAAAHFLDANNSLWDLRGNGNAFVETGTLLEDTSTIRFSGITPNVKQTPYYNLTIDTDRGGSVVATAPVTGLQVLNNLRIGAISTSTLNANINDPVLAVGKNLYIGSRGTLEASNVQTLTVNGNWDNDGVFNANGGTVTFSKTGGSATVAAGNSSFAKLNILGTAGYIFTENATTTNNMVIQTGTFTLNPGLTLAVGGSFTNTMNDINTTWTGTTLSLYSGTAFQVNTKATGEKYNNIVTANDTHPRLWNSTTTSVTTHGISSVYSMDHQRVDGSLYIFGDYVNEGYNDYWNYAEDFDGAVLGTKRQAKVRVEAGGSIKYPSGSLYIVGSSTASTTVSVQTAGTYQLLIGGDTDVEMNHYVIRDTTADGLIFTGAPDIIDLSYGDLEVQIAEGTAMTVGGTVINANPAMEFNRVGLATTTAINAYNVTATGTSASAWRFVNVVGNLGGEAKDVDPGGDPGYVTWQDSAAIINISGTVYSDEASNVSAACDSTTGNIYLSINGTTFATTTCNGDGLGGGTGAYTFTGINYGLGNTLTVYINNEAEKAVTVTQDPISSITNLDLYENRVVVRHESGAAMTIADMGTWDSDDDPDVLFDVETVGADTLTLPADTKLIVTSNKKFTPAGSIIVPGGGSGSTYDGTVELKAGAIFTGGSNQSHVIGGSLISGAGASFVSGQSTTTFTSVVTGRTIDTNEAGFYNLTLNGAGDWTVSDTELSIGNDLVITSGDLTLPAATTTISGSLENTGGTFDNNGGILLFDSGSGGNTVELGGSDANRIEFSGAGSWSFADVNATATDSFIVDTGTVTLPSGTLTIGEDFIVTDTVAHAGGTVKLIATDAGNFITLSGNDLADLRVVAGAGDYTLTDASAALTGNLFIESGTFKSGAGTLSIAGSFDATGGVFLNNSGTILFNSGDTGEFVDPGINNFYNLQFAGAGGGWTILNNATTTHNFTLSTGSLFTMSSGTVLYVGGVFTNTLGGSATEWLGSNIVLDSGTEYETNLKNTPAERYNILTLGENTDISSWNSSATSTSIPSNSSWYSQDHSAVDGSLYIYGDYHITTTTEYWSRSTDFDGVALGSPRAVSVAIASSSVIYVDGGSLNMVGATNATTTVTNQGTGRYSFFATSGTINGSYYSFRNLDTSGLQMIGNINVTSLSNGDFEIAQDDSVAITINSNTVNNNASLIITSTRFADNGFAGGVNVSLDATTTNSWLFTGQIGNMWGEGFDIDGTDDCSSIRWDNSSCLLTEQATYRWRNDDGGEGAPSGTWYNSDFTARKRVRVVNDDSVTYTNVPVKFEVQYDADMQADFDDIRFTDATGVNVLEYWRERYTSATDADFWVKIPTLATSSVTEIYMYYGDVSTTTTSEISNIFNAYDDFDDNNITEYSGEVAKFATAGTFAFGGGYGLDSSPNANAKALDGIGRTDFTVSQGEIIRYMQYVDTAAGSGDEVCTLFGMQSPVTINQNYAVCLEQFGIDRVSLVKNAQNTDSSGTKIGTTTITYSTGWYEIEVDWQTNNRIDVSVYNNAGTLVATTSAIDSTYTTGGFGFTFWGQHGGWDSFVSWPRTESKPTVYFGAEQVDGGASWAALQNTPVGGFNISQTARLRIGIENTGLPITNQNFRLEFAPKLTAPSCQAVSSGSFVQVPVLASCGSSEICMTTSSFTSNGDTTTDHLVTVNGEFSPGKIVANTANQTTAMDVDQNKYTELEYSLKLTVNAVNDAYCFRVTDGGSLLDSYASLPELTLAFDPFLDTLTLNNGFDISLNPGATTTVIASTTVTDYNGVADLFSATTTFYKTSVGAACTPDNNNCYVASGTACSFTDCTANSCTLSCSVDMQFHADPTDSDGGEQWFAFMEVEDLSGGNDFGTSPAVELLTLRALDVQNSIGYGTVDINQNTGSYNPDTEILNIGNESIDVQISGTDMTDGVTSVIPATQQVFATTTFDYSTCVSCNSLSVTGTNVEVDLTKPVVDDPLVSDDIYWGIEVPFGTASNPHSGVNTFTAIAD